MIFLGNYFGGLLWYLMIFLAALFGMNELYRIFGIARKPSGILGYAALTAFYGCLYFGHENYALPLFSAFLLLELILLIVTYPKTPDTELAAAVFGLFYVGVLFSALCLLREEKNGFFLVWLVFIGAWGSDTFAYLTGMTLGKHKAFPVLSPKKSWEGCIGGVVGSALLGLIYAFIFENKLSGLSNPKLFVPVIMALTSVLSQCGDLAASAIKRQHNIKDYGKLIPGHGGIMDRFDSILFAAPAIFYLLKLFCI